MKPEELFYNKTHEWAYLVPSGTGTIATVGISAFAVQQLTDLVYIALPEVGRQVRSGEPFGEIESVKAVSDLYSPVTGEVVEVNAALRDSLEIFSRDPYGDAWVIRVKITDETGLEQLLDYVAYQRQCAEES